MSKEQNSHRIIPTIILIIVRIVNTKRTNKPKTIFRQVISFSFVLFIHSIDFGVSLFQNFETKFRNRMPANQSIISFHS